MDSRYIQIQDVLCLLLLVYRYIDIMDGWQNNATDVVVEKRHNLTLP